MAAGFRKLLTLLWSISGHPLGFDSCRSTSSPEDSHLSVCDPGMDHAELWEPLLGSNSSVYQAGDGRACPRRNI